ncbi:hypothetical protein HGRIS_011618 [Hohenbuehelia grisea]|uniref:Uncharacterized protein n=1 Tax=Hohenbuehelia grisea TaxID=104357 RepID=A0ABR3JVP5_9AGAR
MPPSKSPSNGDDKMTATPFEEHSDSQQDEVSLEDRERSGIHPSIQAEPTLPHLMEHVNLSTAPLNRQSLMPIKENVDEEMDEEVLCPETSDTHQDCSRAPSLPIETLIPLDPQVKFELEMARHRARRKLPPLQMFERIEPEPGPHRVWRELPSIPFSGPFMDIEPPPSPGMAIQPDSRAEMMFDREMARIMLGEKDCMKPWVSTRRTSEASSCYLPSSSFKPYRSSPFLYFTCT